MNAIDFQAGTVKAHSVAEASWFVAQELVMRGFDLWCEMHMRYSCGCRVQEITLALRGDG